jgi:hypothetical protein
MHKDLTFISLPTHTHKQNPGNPIIINGYNVCTLFFLFNFSLPSLTLLCARSARVRNAEKAAGKIKLFHYINYKFCENKLLPLPQHPLLPPPPPLAIIVVVVAAVLCVCMP